MSPRVSGENNFVTWDQWIHRCCRSPCKGFVSMAVRKNPPRRHTSWELTDCPRTSSECSYPEFSRSPLFVAVKTQGSQSSKKTPTSINRCSTLLHRTPSGVPPTSQSQMFRAPNSGSPGSKAITGTNCLSTINSLNCLVSSPALGWLLTLPGLSLLHPWLSLKSYSKQQLRGLDPVAQYK